MPDVLNRLFQVEPGEWEKLAAFGLFGLLLQAGVGVGFAAGDAAFLAHVGSGKLPVIFLLTPVVMIVYTAVFSVLQARFSPGRVVDLTLVMLAVGGIAGWALLGADLPPSLKPLSYYALKLYLAMWYIGLYSLFWTFTDAYFDIQDAKRLFPLLSAACALGVAIGGVIVSVGARAVPIQGFLLVWSGLALVTLPVARGLRRRWRRIADTDADLDDEHRGVAEQLKLVAGAFRTSRYALLLTMTLFVTLLITNLAEFQYATVLQKGRSEAQLARLFGELYAGASVFNLVVCLFVFNRLVTRIGVRNVALVQPLTYFAVFAWFFLVGGTGAALGAFFAYHGVLTSIEYNNQNLLFNATPSAVKRPLRTIVEGLCEPLASLVAGGFLLIFAKHADMRQLSGLGVILGAGLVAVVMALRNDYPAAMGANMRRGWLNFGDPAVQAPDFDDDAKALLADKAAEADSGVAAAARALLYRGAPGAGAGEAIDAEHSAATEAFAAKLYDPSPSVRKYALQALASVVGPGDIDLIAPLVDNLPRMDRASRETILDLLAAIGDVEAIPQILVAAAQLSPPELRAAEAMLAGLGEAAAPRLVQALGAEQLSYRARAIAARALAELSPAQLQSQVERLVRRELAETGRRLAAAEALEGHVDRSAAVRLLARAHRERIGAAVDFTLELLALGGTLPDFDLLIVSLHSANPKVRANAIESIASGVDHATWRLLEPLLRQGAPRAAASDAGLAGLLQDTLADAVGFEAAATAQALRDTAPGTDLAGPLRRALQPGLPSRLRESLAAMVGLGGDVQAPTLVDLVAALAAQPQFAAASLEALAALAERATPQPVGRKPTELVVRSASWWLARADIDDVAQRYADLALTMLRARDGRAYAA